MGWDERDGSRSGKAQPKPKPFPGEKKSSCPFTMVAVLPLLPYALVRLAIDTRKEKRHG